MPDYPQDDTGQLLAEIAEAGLDLNQEHTLDFYYIFERRDLAEAMLQALEGKPEIASLGIAQNEEVPSCWDLRISIAMRPDYHAIHAIESRYQHIADQYNGYFDGWGVLQPS